MAAVIVVLRVRVQRLLCNPGLFILLQHVTVMLMHGADDLHLPPRLIQTDQPSLTNIRTREYSCANFLECRQVRRPDFCFPINSAW